MATTTPNLGLTLPTPNVDTGWGSSLNTDFTAIDSLFAAGGSGTSVGLNVGSGKTLLLGGTLLLGTGDGTGTLGAPTIRGPAATGSNVAGTNLTVDASNGTGTGGSGKLIFRTAPSAGTGASPNVMRSSLEVNAAGAIGVNSGTYGTANQVLTSGGSGAATTWSDVNGSLINISGQAQGDIIYRGASSWDRLAAGTSGQVLKTNGAAANPSWTNIQTQIAAQTISATGNSFTGIPSSAKQIVIAVYACDPDGTADVLVRVGAGSFLATGYTSASSVLGTTTSTATATNGVLINANGAGFNGAIRLTNVDANRWIADYTLFSSGSTRTIVGGGSIDVGGSLDRVQVIPATGTLVASGTISVYYM